MIVIVVICEMAISASRDSVHLNVLALPVCAAAWFIRPSAGITIIMVINILHSLFKI